MVEDECALREALCVFLELRGFAVTRAGTLAEAHRHLAGTAFDAAILDVMLPDGDGLSLLPRARPERSVVISALPDERRYEQSGVRHRLAKPLDLSALERLVRSLAGAGS